MIYLLAAALILTVFGFIRKAGQKGFVAVSLDSLAAGLAGLLAGLLIGAGARIGMGAIALANGDASRFTVSGSLQVILLFSGFGIGPGLIYELLLRDLLGRKSGWLFGFLLTVILWYPLGAAALEQIRFQPSFISVIFWTFFFVALIWLPFALTLEMFLGRWHRWSENFMFAKPVGKSS